MATQITVLGLGRIGTSIGLALTGHKEQLLRVGNDRDLATARAAEKMGAFDKTVINLHQAVENAEVVVLAMPVDEVEETLRQISDDLKPGTVVLDTSPVKQALIDQAAKLLGSDRYYVTLGPTLNPAYLTETGTGIDAAHADLFKNSLMVIASPPGVHAGAIQLATDMAALLGAAPFFADALEADGLMAASHTLPLLLSAALVHAAADQPGWREGKKLAGQNFALNTLLLDHLTPSKNMGREAVLNKQNVMRVLDNLIDSLETARSMVEQGNDEALHEYLEQARLQRTEWVKQRTTANWDSATQTAPTKSEIMGRLIGWRPKDKKK